MFTVNLFANSGSSFLVSLAAVLCQEDVLLQNFGSLLFIADDLKSLFVEKALLGVQSAGQPLHEGCVVEPSWSSSIIGTRL